MYSKILVPMDGTNMTEQILPQIEDLAKNMQAEVVLLGVEKEPKPFWVAGQAVAAGKHLMKAAHTLRTKGLHVSTICRKGHPAQEICRCASESRCDLIAMVTRSHHKIAGMMKSMAEKVVSHATVPVLLLQEGEGKPKKKHAQQVDLPDGFLCWGSE